MYNFAETLKSDDRSVGDRDPETKALKLAVDKYAQDTLCETKGSDYERPDEEPDDAYSYGGSDHGHDGEITEEFEVDGYEPVNDRIEMGGDVLEPCYKAWCTMTNINA